ncbi:MAG TPA: L,D-transpeptidase family protein [Geobacteraceae bacterium]
MAISHLTFTRTAAALLASVCLLPAQPVRAVVQQADKVLVLKSRRLMLLLKGDHILKSYRVALGRRPVGRKRRQGDGRTPEGTYVVDRRNEHSRYHRSLHISYPNAADVAYAGKHGADPGKDIMIHGLPDGYEDLAEVHTARNWTRGCIAVSNGEIDEIWHLVPDGTPIEIKP